MAGLAVGTRQKSRAPQNKTAKPTSGGKISDAKPATVQGKILQMQSMIGNRAVLQMMRSGTESKPELKAGAGKSMPAAVQAKMEGAFNTDFSGVSIHESPGARSIGAKAYTRGNSIHFSPGQYKPDTLSGQRLLGHELAHVVQQREGRVSAPQGKGLPVVVDSSLESEADRLGDRAAMGQPVQGKLSMQLKQDPAMEQRRDVSHRPAIGAQLNTNTNAPIQGNWFTSLFSRKKKKENETSQSQVAPTEQKEEQQEEGQNQSEKKQDALMAELTSVLEKRKKDSPTGTKDEEEKKAQEKQKPAEEKKDQEEKKETSDDLSKVPGAVGSAKEAGLASAKQIGPVIGAPELVGKNLEQEPSSSDIKIEGADAGSPEKALKAYLDSSADNIKQIGRHEIKIGNYVSYLEADFEFVKTAVDQYNKLKDFRKLVEDDLAKSKEEDFAGTAAEKHMKKLIKDKKSTLTKIDKDILTIKSSLSNERKIEDENGETKKVRGEEPEIAVGNAENRLQMAYGAAGVVDAEKPVVGYAYDRIKEMTDDVAQKDKETNKEIKKAKKSKQTLPWKIHPAFTLADSYLGEAGGLAKQSVMSEKHVKVKRKQLKACKATVKNSLGRGVKWWQYWGPKLFFKPISIGLSIATLGAVELDTAKTKGGYSSKTRPVVTYWNNFDKDMAEFEELARRRPFGELTEAHIFIKGVNELLIKPIRNMFGGVATIAAMLSLIPPLAPVTGPIAAICTTVAVILTMVKASVDALLAAWNLLALAMNTNPRNSDLLKTETKNIVGNVLEGVGSIGAHFGGSAVGNLAGGSFKSAFDVVNTGKLSLGNSGSGGMLATLASQGTNKGASIGGTVASLGLKSNVKAQSTNQSAMSYQMPQQSENNPAWVNKEIEKEQNVRKAAKRGLAAKAGNQLARTLSNTQKVKEKTSESDKEAKDLEKQVNIEAVKKDNPSGIQDSDKKNVKGMRDSVQSGTDKLKLFTQNLKDGMKLTEEIKKAV